MLHTHGSILVVVRKGVYSKPHVWMFVVPIAITLKIHSSESVSSAQSCDVQTKRDHCLESCTHFCI